MYFIEDKKKKKKKCSLIKFFSLVILSVRQYGRYTFYTCTVYTHLRSNIINYFFFKRNNIQRSSSYEFIHVNFCFYETITSFNQLFIIILSFVDIIIRIEI